MTRKCPKIKKNNFISNEKHRADGKVIVVHGACKKKTLFLESNWFGEIRRIHTHTQNT